MRQHQIADFGGLKPSIVFNRDMYRKGYDIQLMATDMFKKVHDLVITKATVEEIPEGEAIPPLIRMDNNSMQDFFDSLWDSGLRPSEKTRPSEVHAMSVHLNDMRTIVFHKLGIGEKL